VFIDDRVLRSGDKIPETLRKNVQSSALLLVLMSPHYTSSDWCIDELKWFFEQASKDGRDQSHCCVLRIQPLDDAAWPKHLLDERGKPVHFLDLVDARTELPIHLTNVEEPRLTEALLEAFIEIKGKLKALRKHLEARRNITPSPKQRPADRPVIYLDANPVEEALWKDKRVELKNVAIVEPRSLPPSTGDADPLGQEQKRKRHDLFAVSEGLVLLHDKPGDWIEAAVRVAHLDRRLLRQRHRDLPWAILDLVGTPPEVAEDYDVPCVPGTSPEWQGELLAALGLSPPESERTR
jgi:hypothetical protein